MRKRCDRVLDYVNAVKRADREREIAEHGKLISTRPARVMRSRKVYSRQENKKIRDSGDWVSVFFLLIFLIFMNLRIWMRLAQFLPGGIFAV